MKWASAISGVRKVGRAKPPDAQKTFEDLSKKISAQLDGQRPDLCIAFVSPHFAEQFDDIPAIVGKAINPQTFIGCSAGGIIGGGEEIEQRPGIAVTAAVLPNVSIDPFHVTDEELPDGDASPDRWEELFAVKSASEPSFILLPDPFSFEIDALVQGLDFAFPHCTKLGGLASGASQPLMNALFLNDETYRRGCVGLAIAGNVMVDTVVAQGCRPVGRPLRVTACQHNFLFELDGQPAVYALQELLSQLSEKDQELAHNSLFLGLVMDEFKDNFKPGDFVIRNILGIEPKSGALMVGETLHTERTVQFHLRDAATSADDLRFMLKRYMDKCKMSGFNKAQGALLFSCLGRGEYLYGQPNHDSNCFREYIGEVPLGGFFCNGEIGPVGGTTFLHGYTSSFGIFREKQSAV